VQEEQDELRARKLIGVSWIAVVFAAITWRYDDGEPAGELAVTQNDRRRGDEAAPAVVCPSPYSGLERGGERSRAA
jgi:hypothetical protein